MHFSDVRSSLIFFFFIYLPKTWEVTWYPARSIRIVQKCIGRSKWKLSLLLPHHYFIFSLFNFEPSKIEINNSDKSNRDYVVSIWYPKTSPKHTPKHSYDMRRGLMTEQNKTKRPKKSLHYMQSKQWRVYGVYGVAVHLSSTPQPIRIRQRFWRNHQWFSPHRSFPHLRLKTALSLFFLFSLSCYSIAEISILFSFTYMGSPSLPIIYIPSHTVKTTNHYFYYFVSFTNIVINEGEDLRKDATTITHYFCLHKHSLSLLSLSL